MEMILKAVPKDLATEAVQKRYEEPTDLMLMIMTKYQPGSRRKKKCSYSRLQTLKLVEMKIKR